MSIDQKFLRQLVGELEGLKQRPYSIFTRQLTRGSLAGTLVQLYGEDHKLNMEKTADMVEIIELPNAGAGARLTLPLEYPESFEIGTQLLEHVEYHLTHKGDVIIISNEIIPEEIAELPA